METITIVFIILASVAAIITIICWFKDNKKEAAVSLLFALVFFLLSFFFSQGGPPPPPPPTPSPQVSTSTPRGIYYENGRIIVIGPFSKSSHTTKGNPDFVPVEIEYPLIEDGLTYEKTVYVNAPKKEAIYLLPKPDHNNGALTTVAHKSAVYVVAEHNGFYFVTNENNTAVGWAEIGMFSSTPIS